MGCGVYGLGFRLMVARLQSVVEGVWRGRGCRVQKLRILVVQMLSCLQTRGPFLGLLMIRILLLYIRSRFACLVSGSSRLQDSSSSRSVTTCNGFLSFGRGKVVTVSLELELHEISEAGSRKLL